MEKTRDNYFNNHLCYKNIWKIQLSMRLMERNTIMSQQMIYYSIYYILYDIILYYYNYYILLLYYITLYYYLYFGKIMH